VRHSSALSSMPYSRRNPAHEGEDGGEGKEVERPAEVREVERGHDLNRSNWVLSNA